MNWLDGYNRGYGVGYQNGLLAAIADTHPKDGDVEQAPLVSGGGAGTAIAHNAPPSPSIGSIDMKDTEYGR